MSPSRFTALSAVVLSGAALAQAPAPQAAVGVTVEVQGLVTVSQGANVGSVASNTPVIDGSRYVTASTGSLTLKFNDGCILKLAPNQSLTVNTAQPCPARIAAIRTLGNQAGGGVLANGGGEGLVAAGLFAGGIAAVNAAGGGSAAPVTPPPGGGGGTTPVTPPPSGGGGGVIPNPPASGQ